MNQTVEKPETHETSEAPLPTLPRLYRTLSSLISKPEHLMNQLIQVKPTHDSIVVQDIYQSDPILTLREEPNPLWNSRSNTPQPPGPLCMTIRPESEDSEEPESLSALIAQHFNAVLLVKTREILRRAGEDALQPGIEDWDRPEHTQEILKAARCVIHAATGLEQIQSHTEYLEREIQDAMSEMMDERVLETVKNWPIPISFEEIGDRSETTPDRMFKDQQATLSGYNKATLLFACSPGALEANRGAIPWMLAQPISQETYVHEGQFIGAERRTAMEYGISPKGWTRMTRMDQQTTQDILHYSRSPWDASGTINWLATLNQKIDRQQLIEILLGIGSAIKLTPETGNLRKENLKKVALLAVGHERSKQESYTETRQARENISDAITYAHQAATEGSPVTAKTWNGLMKAIHRWHERMNEKKTRAEWERIVSANQGKIRSWEPLLELWKDEEITATELTDEHMLLEEALEMKHCVHIYGQAAEKGQVRIFALRSKESNRATTSVVQRDGSWIEQQTRGYRNHPPAPAIQQWAQKLVNACNNPAQEPAPGGENQQ